MCEGHFSLNVNLQDCPWNLWSVLVNVWTWNSIITHTHELHRIHNKNVPKLMNIMVESAVWMFSLFLKMFCQDDEAGTCIFNSLPGDTSGIFDIVWGFTDKHCRTTTVGAKNHYIYICSISVLTLFYSISAWAVYFWWHLKSFFYTWTALMCRQRTEIVCTILWSLLTCLTL